MLLIFIKIIIYMKNTLYLNQLLHKNQNSILMKSKIKVGRLVMVDMESYMSTTKELIRY